MPPCDTRYAIHDTRSAIREHSLDDSTPMTDHISRRRALTILGAAPVASVLQQTPPQQPTGTPKPPATHTAPNQPSADTKIGQPSQPKARVLNQREMRTLRVLADDIIPRDERSGSATDAGVPAFVDYHLSVEETTPETRTQWKGGLRWLDNESLRRFNKTYASATQAERHQILDDIAYPDRVKPEFRAGASFFGRARDMIGAGFFSSAIGHKDLRYIGNTFNPNWNGCPPEALAKLGVSYEG